MIKLKAKLVKTINVEKTINLIDGDFEMPQLSSNSFGSANLRNRLRFMGITNLDRKKLLNRVLQHSNAKICGLHPVIFKSIIIISVLPAQRSD